MSRKVQGSDYGTHVVVQSASRNGDASSVPWHGTIIRTPLSAVVYLTLRILAVLVMDIVRAVQLIDR